MIRVLWLLVKGCSGCLALQGVWRWPVASLYPRRFLWLLVAGGHAGGRGCVAYYTLKTIIH